jgi:transcriptional regulator with XRE-family HTH domain
VSRKASSGARTGESPGEVAAEVPSLGTKLRNLRRSRGLTMRNLAAASDLTESFISQVERDSVNPSIASLLRIVGALGVHIADLFDPVGKPNGGVVRKSQRSRLIYPGFASTDSLLSPNLRGKLQVTWAESDVGGSSGDQSYTHPGDEECIVLIKGTLEVWVGTERYVLKAGDAITFESRTPHKWKNVGRGRMTAIWIVTPPSY